VEDMVLKEQVFARAQCQTPSSVQGGGGGDSR
jgi:hypothetical protein